MKIFRAFTLAEVLITMAIVGVIAGITIPVVTSNHQKNIQLLAFKKVYKDLLENLTVLSTETHKGLYNSTLSLKSKTVTKEDGSKTLEQATVADTAGKFLKDYYPNSITTCSSSAQPCFASSYKRISDNASKAFTCAGGYSEKIKSGAAICIIPADKAHDGDDSTAAASAHPATVYIDTNGFENPNIGGRDMFTLYIYDDYSLDELDPATARSTSSKSERNKLAAKCTSSYFGEGCFSRILNADWKIDY